MTLPSAMLIGAAIAIKPAMQLVAMGSGLLHTLPLNLVGVSTESVPQLPTILLGGALLVIVMLGIRLLEE